MTPEPEPSTPTPKLVYPHWGKVPLAAGIISLVVWLGLFCYYCNGNYGYAEPDEPRIVRRAFELYPLGAGAFGLIVTLSSIPLAIHSARKARLLHRWPPPDRESVGIRPPVVGLLAAGLSLGLLAGWFAKTPFSSRACQTEMLVPKMTEAIEGMGKRSLGFSELESTLRVADAFRCSRSWQSAMNLWQQLSDLNVMPKYGPGWRAPDDGYGYAPSVDEGSSSVDMLEIRTLHELLLLREDLTAGFWNHDRLVAAAICMLVVCPVAGLIGASVTLLRLENIED